MIAVLLLLLPALTVLAACHTRHGPSRIRSTARPMVWAAAAVVALGVVAGPAAAQQWYPSDCVLLSVPFLTQVPPGQWENTHNCGPTRRWSQRPRTRGSASAAKWVARRNGTAASMSRLRDRMGSRRIVGAAP